VIEPEFRTVDAAQIDQACRLADEAFDTFRSLSDEKRAASSTPSPTRSWNWAMCWSNA
jgi:hypothetical protein